MIREKTISQSWNSRYLSFNDEDRLVQITSTTCNSRNHWKTYKGINVVIYELVLGEETFEGLRVITNNDFEACKGMISWNL